jgi:acyl-CoA synthetase (NDP forming)
LSPRGVFPVIPAQAGIQGIQLMTSWIPACAGMTRVISENAPTLEIVVRIMDTLKTTDPILKTALDKGQSSLSEYDSKRLLKAYGIPVVEESVALTRDDASDAAARIGYPVVVKGLGSRLLHKTEKGLVHLNLHTPKDVLQATADITKNAGPDLEGFLVQPLVAGKREWAAGMFRDPQFGPVIMFGAGGIFAEALSDVAFRLAPLTLNDAAEMLSEIKAQALLNDFRGERRVDRDALVAALMGLSRLALDLPQVSEIDINPLVTRKDGSMVAVDALAILGDEAEGGGHHSCCPNTMGICNPHIDFFCTGTSVRPLAGSTAVVAQSGNMGTQLLAFAEEQGIGIRAFSGSGNEAMITIEDYMEGFEVDELTRTVMLYIESVKHGRRFFESARRVSRKNPSSC